MFAAGEEVRVAEVIGRIESFTCERRVESDDVAGGDVSVESARRIVEDDIHASALSHLSHQ